MSRLFRPLILFLMIPLVAFGTATANNSLDSFQQDQIVHGFKVTNLYENSMGKVMGARLISDKYGYIIDLIQVQSVPQAFYWIKTPPTSSMGEPHACEHLLLGKGNRGRYVAALEDMALASSSAFTAQTRTCYHFNTIGGDDTFYDVFEAKLNALLNPDFTDEEIQREVCHIGVIENDDGTLSIDEKGTVYTEMVSSFEKPWYHYGRPLEIMVYGEDHPLTNVSGGEPHTMRRMTPQDMWNFHKETHHLANMGAVVSIPSDLELSEFLPKMSEILERVQKEPTTSETSGIGNFIFPPKNPDELETTKIVSYPSQNDTDPGYINFAWPADLELNYKEKFLFELFFDAFASGETSNLYNLFINSKTRKFDLGASYVYGGYDDAQGVSAYIGFGGIDNKKISEAMIDSIWGAIQNSLNEISTYSSGSEKLTEFNNRVRGIVEQDKKRLEHYLNSPPMFGFRSGAGARWVSIFEELEEESGFRKSLVFKDRYNFIMSLLESENNFWSEYIDNWKLVSVKPYAVGAKPDPEYVTKEANAKAERIAAYLENFKSKYGTDNEQEAIVKYKAEFDKKTAELKATAGEDVIPEFTDNPPMTLDDQLDYEESTLNNNIPFVASTFENMTSSEFGIALRLDVVPESMLVYVPFLPSVITDIGVIKDNETVEYNQMIERLRNEVLNFYAYFSQSATTDRIELVLVGRGNSAQELNNAIDWMAAGLNSPYLSKENLPRIRDLIDQSIKNLRNRMKRSEESWVNSPAEGYLHQDNPLYMTTRCFLTEMHHYYRLKWLLTDVGSDENILNINSFIEYIANAGGTMNREDLVSLLGSFKNGGTDSGFDLTSFSEQANDQVTEITDFLNATLADIPDANLSDDWGYLCGMIKNDIAVKPEKALSDLSKVLSLLRKTDNTRTFMISNSTDRQAVKGEAESFLGTLNSDQESIRYDYTNNNRIVERLESRHTGIDKPVYVGLVNEATQNGVLIFSTKLYDVYDTSDVAVLDCLAGKVFSGYGPHGFFMKTWAAGLAYSNGFRFNQTTGQTRYYAERCPDVAETMKFVVDQIKETKLDPGLSDYAIAQVFRSTRAPSRYEARGEAIAADLADNITPEKVKQHRLNVLKQKYHENLFEKLQDRFENVYGSVLAGYGPSLEQYNNGNYFLIGPETQFESLEKYIESTESPNTIYRLYPRDFWLTL